jgi:hypothetical protein
MSATTHQPRPKWWNKEYDSAWERVKEAFRRDWEQTKHDFGGNEPDLNQHVDDTVGQAAGTRSIPPRGVPNFDENESAYRYGYGAHRHYRETYPDWNADLEEQLRADWGSDWEAHRNAVRRGWEYQG